MAGRFFRLKEGEAQEKSEHIRNEIKELKVEKKAEAVKKELNLKKSKL